MKNMFPITYNSSPEDGKEASFQVHTPKGIVEFKPCSKGLHYYDMSSNKRNDTICVQTVQGNFEGFTKAKVIRAIKARKLQSMMGSPARADFEGMVRGKLIDDCPIDIANLRNAHKIFGPDLAGLLGRTVRRRPT
jgi:hypothetical protein